MRKVFFSILTPVYLHNEYRKKMFLRCLRSVINQTFTNFEHIIVDDGSPIKVDLPNDGRQVVIRHPRRYERVIALNKAFKKARGEYFCFLDSDDEYLSIYLETVYHIFKTYPQYKVCNFGAIYIHRDYNVTLKPVFAPKKLKKGHEVFRSGKIVNGTFVFHRSCFEKIGVFPEVTNPWDFARETFKQFPETKELYRLPDGRYTEVGNPWGNDWQYFYRLTREYHSIPINTYLYVVHSRLGQKKPITIYE